MNAYDSTFYEPKQNHVDEPVKPYEKTQLDRIEEMLQDILVRASIPK